jgi:hypothetical protein
VAIELGVTEHGPGCQSTCPIVRIALAPDDLAGVSIKISFSPPPNHAQTILGSIALVLLVVIGLISRGGGETRGPAPTASPSMIAAPSPSLTAAAPRASATPVRPRRS